MSDYDFSELNDKEFEILCADLIGDEHCHRFERFKPGRDSGVDGRYFSSEGKEIVLQCKHWPATPIEKLLNSLEQVEAPKVARLKPQRYILAISKPLSRRDKTILRGTFAPYIKRENDIYGREDLNQLLSTRPVVLRRHTKLWLKSAEVLSVILNQAIHGRSQFALDEMVAAARTYVRTGSHEMAVRIADESGIVIIAGEPGIGKTTLAEQLCLEYVANGYTFLKVADDIAEAEAVFSADEDQLFYFDDFLGQNYLDAYRGTAGSHIVQFMKRVSKNMRNKRFILTSRSTILNRGKLALASYRHGNIEKNEHVLTIASLTPMDRALILYNHIWFSALPAEYVEEIYRDKRYRKIIDHENYNPRLIQFVTDHERLKECLPAQYWRKIEQSLDNPSEVWEHPFNWQLESNGRILVLLVVMHGRSISEEDLGAAFARFVGLPSSERFVGGQDFVGTLRHLIGSFLSRALRDKTSSLIDLFNPSIGDYVLRRYASDTTNLSMAVGCLRSLPALSTLRSQLNEGIITKYSYSMITYDLLADMCNEALRGFEGDYIAELVVMNIPLVVGNTRREKLVRVAIQALILEDPPSDCTECCNVHRWALEQGETAAEVAVKFIVDSGTEGRYEEELRALAGLLAAVNCETENWDQAYEALCASAIWWMSETLSTFVSDSDVLADIDIGDTWAGEEAIESAVKEKLKEFDGLNFADSDIQRVTRGYDVEQALIDLRSSTDRPDSYRLSGTDGAAAMVDDIDDLFDRR